MSIIFDWTSGRLEKKRCKASGAFDCMSIPCFGYNQLHLIGLIGIGEGKKRCTKSGAFDHMSFPYFGYMSIVFDWAN